MSPVTRFNGGPTTLMRVDDMRSYVIEESSSAGPSDSSLIELVQTYPLLCAQLALLWFGLANTLLQFVVSTKFSGVIRRQCLIIAMVSAGLDLLMHLNVESGIDAGASTPEKPSIEMNNPFAAFMGAAQGKKSAEKEKRSEEVEDDGPEAINAEYLKRARIDMTIVARGRIGQMLALIVISFFCGAKKHCMVPIFLRNLPLMIRGAVLLLATLSPDLFMPIIMFSETHKNDGAEEREEGTGGREESKKKGKKSKKGKGLSRNKKSYRREGRGRLQIGPINLSPILFPLDMASPTQGDMLQDFCDLLAWPLEQMILSSWMKALSGEVFGATDKGTVKFFGIPVGAKRAKSPPKMSKHAPTTTAVVPPTTGKPLSMVQISIFAAKALFIYNYQKVRSKGITGLKSLPRLMKMLGIPGGEALLGGQGGGLGAMMGNNSQGDNDDDDDKDQGEGGTPPSSSKEDNDKDGGGGERMRALPNATVSTSEAPVPVVVDLKATPPVPAFLREDELHGGGGEDKKKRKTQRKRKRKPSATGATASVL